MNVPSTILSLRRRSLWEALDSGILLWKDSFFYFIPFFAVPLWITAFALFLIPNEFRWISWLGLWWLKPLFDRLCLQVISTRFFRSNLTGNANNDGIRSENTSSSIRTIFSGLHRNFFPYLLGDLLWRRFSPFRPANMCLRLLERLKPKQYRVRKKFLVQGGLNYSVILSSLALPLEIMLLGGEFLFVYVMCESFSPDTNWFLQIGPGNIMLAFYAAYCVNYILVESLFVCMGFGLYINCRTEMEGWDIQIMFQKFTQNSYKVVKAVILCAGFLFAALPTYAQDSSQPEVLTDEAEEEEERIYFPDDFMPYEIVPIENLEEILSSDDFGGYKNAWRVSLKNETQSELPEADLDPLMEKLNEYLALALRAFIVLVLLGFLVFILIRFRHMRGLGLRKKSGKASVNPLVSGENPETLFENADGFFQRGFIKEAWAACLCGTITAYDQYFDLSFPADATEYGCLDVVKARFASENVNAQADSFGDLVRNWVLFAYGGRNPQQGSFEKALAFGRGLKTVSLTFETAKIKNNADVLENSLE